MKQLRTFNNTWIRMSFNFCTFPIIQVQFTILYTNLLIFIVQMMHTFTSFLNQSRMIQSNLIKIQNNLHTCGGEGMAQNHGRVQNSPLPPFFFSFKRIFECQGVPKNSIRFSQASHSERQVVSATWSPVLACLLFSLLDFLIPRISCCCASSHLPIFRS